MNYNYAVTVDGKYVMAGYCLLYGHPIYGHWKAPLCFTTKRQAEKLMKHISIPNIHPDNVIAIVKVYRDFYLDTISDCCTFYKYDPIEN